VQATELKQHSAVAAHSVAGERLDSVVVLIHPVVILLRHPISWIRAGAVA
jgi:hypothetical protein